MHQSQRLTQILTIAQIQHRPRNRGSCERRISQWEHTLRKFSEANKEICKATPMEMPKVRRSVKQFPTGSSYEGTWDLLGMSGTGTYTFPNGVIYEGEFDDGMFHGHGELRYPSGEVIKGTWDNGVITQRQLFFEDGLEYMEHHWPYCKMPDRRFTIEHRLGLQPATCSFMTAKQPPRAIPPGFYDTGDGFYDPKCRVVYEADNLNAILRSPSQIEQEWIVANCRSNRDVSLGPRIDLYEKWVKPDPNYRKEVPTGLQPMFRISTQYKSELEKTAEVAEDEFSIDEIPYEPFLI